MLLFFGILVITALIIAIDVPPLMKQKQKKELILYFILLVIGVTLSSLISFDVKVPNPLDTVEKLVTPLINIIQRL